MDMPTNNNNQDVAIDSAATTDTRPDADNEKTDADNTNNVAEEYKYLQRNAFTSEIYKIELRGLGYFGVGELKKLLKKKFELDATKVKSPNLGKNFAYICFRTAADYERALQELNGYKWKGKILEACAANASPDPLVLKRKTNSENVDLHANKKANILEATCPLAHLPYDEQLKQKTEEIEKIILKYTNELSRVNKSMKAQIKKFQFEGVLPAPQIDGYRNKNEFTVGKNLNGDIVVGFRLGSYNIGSIEVTDVENSLLPHVPEAAKWAAKSFQKFIRTEASELGLEAFNPECNTGHFRQLMVRTSAYTNEIMLVVGMFSSNMSSEQLQLLKEKLKLYYMENVEQNAEYRCTSLYYQDVKNRESGQLISPVEHLAGTEHITDQIHEHKFRISPLAFFQVNTPGAQLLYAQAIKLAASKPTTCVLDVCCGTGTIAICFAKHARNVLGVDIIEAAINDAKLNAKNNDIKNVRFFTGNADDVIHTMVREAVYDCPSNETLDLVAVVDPPRNGLHARSIVALRAATEIKRLVYISCKPARAQRNWIDLCRPESKQYKGEPFYPSKAIAVDMFPHTLHTELVVLFEREIAPVP